MENPLKPAEFTKSERSTSHRLKVAKRRNRVCELRCLGYKISQIKEKLAEEGQVWSEDTIKCDLRSQQAEETLSELIRQQYADIALCESRKVKLEYRDKLIERLMPRKSAETEVNVSMLPKVCVEIVDHSKEPYATPSQSEVQS